MEHWENHCNHCGCRGFAARRLSREEMRIVRDTAMAQRQAGEVKAGEEAYITDILEEWERREIE